MAGDPLCARQQLALKNERIRNMRKFKYLDDRANLGGLVVVASCDAIDAMRGRVSDDQAIEQIQTNA
jgi:hypothetical protein